MPEPKNDRARDLFSVLVICALIIVTLWIILPFLAAIVWATTIVVSTWPFLLHLQARCRGSRGIAAAVMTIALLSIVFVPFLLAVGGLVVGVDKIKTKIVPVQTMQVPQPPDWLARTPVIGGKAASIWVGFAGKGIEDLAAEAVPYASTILAWFVSKVGSIGALLAQFLLTVIVAAVLYVNGEAAADYVLRFGRKLAGDQGEAVVRLAGQAIRSVMLGVVVSAIIQALLTGLGLAIAGIPFPGILTFVSFMLCIAQIGPSPVLLPAVGWLYYSNHPVWGTLLLIWTVIVTTADNVIPSLLMKKGADLPLLLIFTGVLGGLMTLGLIGIFVGPVVLAVAHTLMRAWLDEEEASAESAGSKAM